MVVRKITSINKKSYVNTSLLYFISLITVLVFEHVWVGKLGTIEIIFFSI